MPSYPSVCWILQIRICMIVCYVYVWMHTSLEASKLEMILKNYFYSRKKIHYSTIRLQTMLNHRVNLFMRTGICKLKYKMCSDSILTWSMGSQHISEEMVSSKTEEMIPPAVEMVSLKTFIQVNKLNLSSFCNDVFYILSFFWHLMSLVVADTFLLLFISICIKNFT